MLLVLRRKARIFDPSLSLNKYFVDIAITLCSKYMRNAYILPALIPRGSLASTSCLGAAHVSTVLKR